MLEPQKMVWILEDDPGSQFVYEEILGFRYQLKFFSTLGDLTKCLSTVSERPSLLIADLRLPDQSFLSLLTASGTTPSLQASETLNCPFLVVSSVDDLDALRLCYSAGALDYITKPFGKSELIVKIERILSQFSPGSQIEIDSIHFVVRVKGKSSPVLTSKEFQLFSALFQKPMQNISKTELLSSIWNNTCVGQNTIDVHLSSLRKKLSPLGLSILFQPPHYYRLKNCIENA